MRKSDLRKSFVVCLLAASGVAPLVPGPASAQNSSPAQGQADPASGEKSAPSANSAPKPAATDTKQSNQWTYPMQGGGMYQPPATLPSSPAQDLSFSGRT